MSCTHPLRAFPTGWLTENGKPEYFIDSHNSPLVPALQVEKRFRHPQLNDLVDYVEVPCGHCYECKKSNALRWSIRVQCEAQDYDPATLWFFTLTYDNEHLPADGYPDRKHLSKFVRAVRDCVGHDTRIRFFGCGELGSKTQRAHIHVTLFGFPAYRFNKFRFNNTEFIFPVLVSLWGKGFITGSPIRDVSSCGGYVAKYQLKDFGRNGCWLQASNRPGIGTAYIEKVFGPWGQILIGNGRGSLLHGYAPKCIRDRLSLPADPTQAAASIIRTANKMRSAGYGAMDYQDAALLELFRESIEFADKAQECHRAAEKLDSRLWLLPKT